MQAWEDLLKALEKDLGATTVDRWLRTLKIIRFDAGNLYLEASDPLQISWFDEHVRPRVRGAFSNNNQRPIRIHVSAVNSIDVSGKRHPETASSFAISSDRLDRELTRENFIASPANAMAFKLLAEMDRLAFNPIYLFGPKGCGKTHLLTASAIALSTLGKRVFFVRAETFTSHVVQAIRLGRMQEFRKIYREIDALLVDDVDAFSQKSATQEEFFHTFNSLHTEGKQIVLAASVPPSELTAIEPRLISRFEWGISVAIGKGEVKAILAKKAALWKLPFSSELIEFISEKFPKNPLLAIQGLALRAKCTISPTVEHAIFLLQDLIKKEEEIALSPDKIVQSIAAHFGITPENLLGKSQVREFTLPRQIAMYLCRETLKLSLQKIGEIFGRDHSTVIDSVRQIKKSLKEKALTIPLIRF